MSLDEYQSEALILARSKKSIVLFGSAGSGKSYLLQHILTTLRQEHGGYPKIIACGLSNRTASHLGGQTNHSLFGAPPHWRFSKEQLWNIVRSKHHKMEALRQAEIIVIDEVCIITAGVFDSIDHIFRRLALNDERESLPFGGRQLIVAGDPFQLPAISQAPPDDGSLSRVTHDEKENGSCQISDNRCVKNQEYKEDLPSYMSRAWFLTFGGFGSGYVVFLNANYRQASDRQFFGILQRMRIGKSTAADIREINKTRSNLRKAPSTHTLLCLRKKTAHRKNYEILSSMPGHMYRSEAVDTFLACSPNKIKRRLDDAAPPILYFKEGAAVLLTRTVGDLTPGSRVIIDGVCTRNTPTNAGKSSVDYVVNSVILRAGSNQYFVNLFTFSIRRNDTSVIASRKQLPFISAYAITVHRSQGMTLSTVAMDFSDAETWKPEGMAYVVLSRCTSLNGIWACGLTADHIRVSAHAIALLRNIDSLQKHYPSRFILSRSTGNESLWNSCKVLAQNNPNIGKTESQCPPQL